MFSNEPVNIILITAIAVTIGDGQEPETLDLLSAYFFLIGASLKALSVTKSHGSEKTNSNC